MTENAQQLLYLPYSNSSTSLDAAEAMKPRLHATECKVLAAFRTPDEKLGFEHLSKRTGLGTQSITARIRGLVLRGQLRDSGTTYETQSGRRAILWELNPAPGCGAPKPKASRLAAAVESTREATIAMCGVVALEAFGVGSEEFHRAVREHLQRGSS